MRRVSIEEELKKERPVVRDDKTFCPLCGAEMEMDGESGEYSCPVCDSEQES